MQVVKPEERKTVESLVRIMIALDLRFVQDRTEEGHLVYKLEPPLDAFVSYEGHGVSGAASSALSAVAGGGNKFAIRQMLSKEIDAALIRLETTGSLDQDPRAAAAGSAANALASYRKAGPATAATDLDSKEKIATDFFGRPIVQNDVKKKKVLPDAPLLPGSRAWKAAQEAEKAGGAAGKEAKDATPDQEDEPPKPSKRLKVFYRYHEGYSNAVRRPVKMSDLL